MRNVVLVSFTPLDAGGGVPRWNRDFVKCFPGTKHFSWEDVKSPVQAPEWVAADVLGKWLHATKKVSRYDLIVADGFWGESLADLGYDVISVAHGIWSHLTKEDADSGKAPEFPSHHMFQVLHRKKHLKRGGRIVAVSDFIAEQMRLQWGFESTVVNNAIDLNKFRPPMGKLNRNRSLIIHGVTTVNKGFDHIQAVKDKLGHIADVLLLDEAAKHLGMEKYAALAQADLVVQPSAYEGNSYFVLETIASDVPIVAYNVGLLYSISKIAKSKGIEPCIGTIIDRNSRSPEKTAKVASWILDSVVRDRSVYNPRQVAELFSIQRFKEEWESVLSSYG